MSLTKLLVLYGTFHTTVRSFKALHKSQRFSSLIDEHNSSFASKLNKTSLLSRLDKQEIVPLLHFWTVMAFLHLYDFYLEPLVCWVPFYDFGKIVVLVWILAPQTKGATIFYESFLAPQIEKRQRLWEVVVAPWMRVKALTAARAAQGKSLESIDAVSMEELSLADRTFDQLLRTVMREGYVRKREESIKSLSDAVPNQQQRTALLDDILKEYKDDIDDDAEWTEVRLEKSGNALRVRFGSEFDTDEEAEFAAEDEATVDRLLFGSS